MQSAGVEFLPSRRPIPLAGILLSAIALFALLCPRASAQTTLCGRQPAIPVSDGTYNVQSNEFNSPARECIRVEGTAFSVTESEITSGGPGAYPLIYRGCHWGKCTANSGLPVQVSTLSDLRSDWTMRRPASGGGSAWVAAYDIWFNTTPWTRHRPDGAELMIWLSHTQDLQPQGRRLAFSVRLSGGVYDVWALRKDRGNYIAYVRSSSVDSVKDFDLRAFVRDAVSRGYIRQDWYLISVEAGFELWQGGAGLETVNFSAITKNKLGRAPLNVWWPKEKAVLSGVQPFKARLAKMPVDAYQMFWSVDGGRPNRMADESTDLDHKEASVDFSEWRWRETGNRFGPFHVTFTAQDLSGTVVRQKTVLVYAAK